MLGELVVLGHWAIVIGFSIRVIMKRRQAGASLAWLAVIMSVPVVGAIVYLLFGEKFLPRKALQRAQRIHPILVEWQKDLCRRFAADWAGLYPQAEPLHCQALAVTRYPGIGGNRLQLLEDYASIFDALVADIDRAQSTCHLEFYIWHDGGRADDVAEALIRARGRGVICRIMVDALGSARFAGGAIARRLRERGVEVAVALPPRLLAFSRLDLRNHRKIVVIDGEVAYTGSQNLVDPRFFKQDADVGQWIDVMVRMEGPAVEALAGILLLDWAIVTGADIDALRATAGVKPVPARDGAVVQVVPSGPAYNGEAIRQLILTMIYAARKELILTTPYFIPDDAMTTALKSAALRGVAVTLVVPDRNDSRLVRYASPAHFEDLLATGVRIVRFRGGLLHSKTITVDGSFGLIGTVNLDMRSLWLNFEISLIVYDRAFTRQIRAVQERYVADSAAIDLATWRARPVRRRFVENAAGLLSPLL
ncbi:MAG: cardiolipin synthase [Planctomycetota bacterium]|jgi:cardiolipin synthase